MPNERTSVLVVGGGLTGLSSAVFLAWHGVPCIVVERHPDLLIHPRLYGKRFVLLAGSDANAWTAAAERVAGKLAMPLDKYRFGIELSGGDAVGAHGIGSEGALLVRPDGFVGWRSPHAAAEPAVALERALRSILAARAVRARGVIGCVFTCLAAIQGSMARLRRAILRRA